MFVGVFVCVYVRVRLCVVGLRVAGIMEIDIQVVGLVVCMVVGMAVGIIGVHVCISGLPFWIQVARWPPARGVGAR